MCVSYFIGLQNRVGRSGILFFLQYFFIVLVWDFRQILTKKPQNFSQSGPIYIIFFLYDPNKKTLSRTIKKTESVFEKRVKYFVIVLEWDFSSNI